MFNNKLVAACFLASTCLFAADPWTKTQVGMEIASEVGIACEWAQMMDSTSINGFDAKLMSRHPSRGRLNNYFIGWLIVHPIISYNLPSKYRTGWQAATISFELVVTRNNANVGCRCKF